MSAAHSLRIGFYVFFPGGGIGRYTHKLMGSMGDMPGVSVEVLCSPDFNWREAAEYEAWSGLKPVWNPAPIRRRWWFLRGQLINPLLAIRYARANAFDVLHFANVNHLTFPLWRWALERSTFKTAVSVHDVRRQKSMISRVWEERQLKAVYRYADVLFVHSEHQAGELVEYAGVARNKIHIVPHGPYAHGQASVDRATARRRWGLPSDRQVALFFGQIRDEKNLDELLVALARARRDCHLLIAGKPWSGGHRDGRYYEQHIERLGLVDRVTFLNQYIDDEDVPSLFTAADWVALPYRQSFTSQSGVLNVATHYERPVLVSSAPVLRETVAACDIGVTCVGDDAAALTAGIEALCNRIDEGYTHAFTEYAHRFSWKTNAERTLQAYTTLLSGA